MVLAINDSGLTISGSLARTTAGTLPGEQVGSFAISQGSVVTPSSNYAISYTGANLSITPATLSITANAQTKAYGVNDPSLTYLNSGLVNTTVDGLAINDSGLTINGSLARTTAGTLPGEQVGSFAISQGSVVTPSVITLLVIPVLI